MNQMLGSVLMPLIAGRHFWIEMYLGGKKLRDYLDRDRVEMQSVLAELGLLVSNAGCNQIREG